VLIGASIAAADIEFYEPLFTGNGIMRIFPVEATVGETRMKVLPPWSDARLAYCHRKSTIPFLSCKVDGDQDGLDHVKRQLADLPAWIRDDPAMLVFVTDRHEPEGDLPDGAAAYKKNFNKFLAMVDSLDPRIRAKIKCGPVLTKIWTENKGSDKGQYDYRKYDPGTGDFFGVDSYVQTGTKDRVVSPSTLPAPGAFLKYIREYKFGPADTRPRIFPELGLIGMPADTDGSARAAWIRGVHDEVSGWCAGASGWAQPWSFQGWIWWNQEGKKTGAVPQVGQRRDFALDERTVDEQTVVKLDPPKPLDTFNAIWSAAHSTSTPPLVAATPGGSTPVSYRIGATMKKADLEEYGPRTIPRNGLMRIFPNSNGLPPDWDDERFSYCRENGVLPFASSNIDGDPGKFPAMRQWITEMPGWVTLLLLTDRHEPENNHRGDPTPFIRNYTDWWNACIVGLPPAIRARVMAGPIVTRQWIEGGPDKGDGDYGQFDPGPAVSDLYAIDMYMNSWDRSGSHVADAYPDEAAFLAGLKGYRHGDSDSRPRIIAELGAIGIPSDPTGRARAGWINGICAELDTWSHPAQGWPFWGFAWWNNQGTGGGDLTPIGAARYFYLDKYQDSRGNLRGYADPLPLKALNEQAARHALSAGPGDRRLAAAGVAGPS